MREPDCDCVGEDSNEAEQDEGGVILRGVGRSYAGFNPAKPRAVEVLLLDEEEELVSPLPQQSEVT